jgi:hypothetical protein
MHGNQNARHAPPRRRLRRKTHQVMDDRQAVASRFVHG